MTKTSVGPYGPMIDEPSTTWQTMEDLLDIGLAVVNMLPDATVDEVRALIRDGLALRDLTEGTSCRRIVRDVRGWTVGTIRGHDQGTGRTLADAVAAAQAAGKE